MYKRFAFAGLCALFVGACGSNDGAAGNEAANGVADNQTSASAPQAAGAESVRPGQWQVVSTGDYEETEMDCITPEEARLAFFDPNDENSRQCQAVRNRVGGGVVDIELNCNGYPVIFRGTYTDTTYQLDTSLEVPVNGQRQTIRSQRAGRWVGPQCQDDGGETESAEDSGNSEG